MVKRVLLKLLCVSIVVGGIGGLMPTPALATDAEPSCEEDASVSPYCVATVTDSTEVDRDPLAPAGTSCRSRTQRRMAESLIGLDLWAYYQRITWCWRSGKLTSVSRTRWADVFAPGWDFRGHVGGSVDGGVGSKFYTAFTQGKFQLCVV